MSESSERLTLREVVAMGVGGMIGGGIFSVLGLAMNESGHAAPLAFLLGGLVTLLTGYSYARLGLHYQSDGGSFTYLERAFGHGNLAGIGGWLLLAGYMGTLGLYAYTFGAYGAAMLSGRDVANPSMHHLLETLILLVFLGINLYGVKASGLTELLIVTVKVLILLLFAIIGLLHADYERLWPFFDRGAAGLLMAAALIFVAYEGFELIPNAVNEMEDPQRNLTRGIFWSILITITVYVLVALVAVIYLAPAQVARYEEYALAIAARPFLGQAGFVLIGLAALFSTASAINATLFGTARLGRVMAQERELPRAFAFVRQGGDIPWVSLLVITGVTLLFVNLGDLTVIASFASSTFLLIFFSIHLSALRLHGRLGLHPLFPLVGMLGTLAAWGTLLVYLWRQDRDSLAWIGGAYIAVICAELLFSQRRRFFRSWC